MVGKYKNCTCHYFIRSRPLRNKTPKTWSRTNSYLRRTNAASSTIFESSHLHLSLVYYWLFTFIGHIYQHCHQPISLRPLTFCFYWHCKLAQRLHSWFSDWSEISRRLFLMPPWKAYVTNLKASSCYLSPILILLSVNKRIWKNKYICVA